MPKKFAGWQCKYCGFTSDSESSAQTCEDNHLKVDHIKIQEILLPKRSDFWYVPQGRMPQQIRIVGITAGVAGIYSLVKEE